MTPAHVRRRRIKRLIRLRELGYRDYADYLASPHWRNMRAAYIASDLPQACFCGETSVQLHHKTYERIGAEELTDLMPLCRRCHSLVHVLERRRELSLDASGLESVERAVKYAAQTEAASSPQRR